MNNSADFYHRHRTCEQPRVINLRRWPMTRQSRIPNPTQKDNDTSFAGQFYSVSKNKAGQSYSSAPLSDSNLSPTQRATQKKDPNPRCMRAVQQLL